MKKQEKVFTLIELLVVISIIAIVASMLLPALNKARIKAKAVQCTGNQKQSMLSCLSYAGDFYEFLPKSLDGSTTWAQVLANLNYLSASLNKAKGQTTAVNCPSWNLRNTPSSVSLFYCFGMAEAKLTEKPAPITEITLKDCSRPSANIILADSDCYQYPAGGLVAGGLEFSPRAAGTKYRNGYDQDRLLQIRHLNKTNVAFADGHVQVIFPKDLFILTRDVNNCNKLYYLPEDNITTRLSIP